MKTQETIGLNLAATLLVGLLSSLILFFSGVVSGQTAASSIPFFNSPATLALVPVLFAALAAFFQYRFVMKPWHKALGELVAKALNLQESAPATAPQATRSDQLNLLRESLETASVQYKEVRQREKALIQHAVDVICVIDLKCKILSVNPAAQTVWGYKPDELLGKQITDFLLSDDVKNTMKAIVGAEKSIDRIFFENRFLKKSGEIVDLLWSAHLSASDQGLFCIAHDITDRKLAERLLKESEEKIRGILESLPAGVAVVNPDGKLAFMNRTALDLSGFAGNEISSLPAAKLFSFFKDPSAIETNLSTAGAAPIDCLITRSSGERFPAEASTCSLSWGSSSARLVVFLDATLKYEVERTKREFFAMVSHDLRTPLATISLIFTYLLDGMAGELSTAGNEYANKGQQSCQRLMTQVQDLLDLEKMRAGKFVMDIDETSIKEVIRAAVSAVEPYASSQGIRLSVDAEDRACLCDGGRIIQVLINLLGNAIKFAAAESTIQIKTICADSILTVNVSNRGRTIPAEKLTSIFEKFEQANSREAEERKGTGLGLAISKTLVEQHGGKIWAESSDAEGTRFSFTLPLVG